MIIQLIFRKSLTYSVKYRAVNIIHDIESTVPRMLLAVWMVNKETVGFFRAMTTQSLRSPINFHQPRIFYTDFVMKLFLSVSSCEIYIYILSILINKR